MKVGFIGLGNMGRPMALNLLRAGFDLTVYNRTASKAEEFARRGAGVAGSPRELAGRVDVVLSCLADVSSTLNILAGESGVAGAVSAHQVVVDHSTVDLGTSRKIHDAVRRRGGSFLDAPISGGPEGAADATLSIMVGGDADAFERLRPVFAAMGDTVLHMGDCGAGTATKLVNQLLVGVHTLASCEGLLLGRKAGVEFDKLIRVLKRSWGQSRMLERNAPKIIRRNFEHSAAPLKNLLKDLSIVTELGSAQGIPLPTAEAARTVLARLADQGRGAWDITAAYLELEQAGGEEA